MAESPHAPLLSEPRTRTRFRKARRKVRPWHVYFALAAAAVTVIVTTIAVVVSGEKKREQDIRDQNTPSNLSLARVNLGYSQYQGSLVGTDGGVAQYLGMRYAAPPIENLRFRAPVEPTRRSGDQAADHFGPICIGTSAPYPESGQEEDCLYVNVWAPANATAESRLPVWLFIQGGGYTANANANWNGTQVVERSGRNIIFVNFNYRVGIWGFLASERLRRDGGLNVGLLDQRFVMRWVKNYIAQFGGDPDRIVIQGVSAGAGSVAMHLLAYRGKTGTATQGDNEQLFAGAMGDSVFFPAQPFVADLEWQFDLVLTQTGCDYVSGGIGAQGESAAMDCLRRTDTRKLQDAANIPSPFPGRPNEPLPLFYWTPCIDGDLLPDLPYLMFERGEFVDVPVIMGTTTDDFAEGTIFTPDVASQQEMSIFLRNNYPRLSDNETETILAWYPKMEALPAHKGAWYPSASSAYGEATFICPATHILDSYVSKRQRKQQQQQQIDNTTLTVVRMTLETKGKPRVWGYRYDVYDAHNAAAGLGIPHVWQAWAVFGPESLPPSPTGGAIPESYLTYNKPIVPVVMDYWISFVRTLDPSALKNGDAPTWEEFGALDGGDDGDGGDDDGSGTSSERRRRLVINTIRDTAVEDVPADQTRRCGLWKALAGSTQQ